MLKRFILDTIEICLIAFGSFLILNIFAGQLLEVSGSSMEPTLHDTERIVAEKISLEFKPLEKGEIVIFTQPTDSKRLIIKRIIGTSGDTVEIKEGSVYVNQKQLEEPYLKTDTTTNPGTFIGEMQELTVPEGQYFLLGDNRTNSTDSRAWGFLKKERISGRALLVYQPIKQFRFIEGFEFPEEQVLGIKTQLQKLTTDLVSAATK